MNHQCCEVCQHSRSLWSTMDFTGLDLLEETTSSEGRSLPNELIMVRTSILLSRPTVRKIQEAISDRSDPVRLAQLLDLPQNNDLDDYIQSLREEQPGIPEEEVTTEEEVIEIPEFLRSTLRRVRRPPDRLGHNVGYF